MKNFLLFTLILLITNTAVNAQVVISVGPKKKVLISCDQTDAKIFVNGAYLTTGSAQVKISWMTNLNVRIEKVGFITVERNYNNNGSSVIPKKEFFKMEVDDAFSASNQTDMANRDNEIKTSLTEDAAWKLISQIVTNYFDVVEVSDRNTGYLRTAWVQKSFKSSTIRTRLIIKMGNSDPLTYKIKMVSEKARPGASIKEDEAFKEWDRLLKTYEPIINEIQTRLAAK